MRDIEVYYDWEPEISELAKNVKKFRDDVVKEIEELKEEIKQLKKRV